MARLQRARRINTEKPKVIAENILKQNPEGIESTEDLDLNRIVIAKEVPKYRRVTFLNGRDPGYPLDFHYSSKTHPLKIYKIFHGQSYDLPEEVIEHLESCNEPKYKYVKGEDGHPQLALESRKYIFQLRNVRKQAA